MKNIRSFGRTFRHIALALVCVLTMCALVPAGIGTQAGILSKTEAAESPAVIGAASFTYPVGRTGKLSLKSGGDLRFYSSDPEVFEIEKKTGYYTALKAGSAKLTIKRSGKVVTTADITVIRNYKEGSSTVKQTGFTAYSKDGTGIKPTVNAKLKSVEFLSHDKVKLKFILNNFSKKNWKSVEKIDKLRVRADGVTFISKDELLLNKGFSLPAGKTITWTLVLSGKKVKKFVELDKVSKLTWTLNWGV